MGMAHDKSGGFFGEGTVFVVSRAARHDSGSGLHAVHGCLATSILIAWTEVHVEAQFPENLQ